MRAGALSDEAVGRYVGAHFVSAWRKVGTFQVVQFGGKTAIRQGGNIAVYFCTPELEVVNAIAGPVSADVFLREAQWAVETFSAAMTSSKGEREALVAAIDEAHENRVDERMSLKTRGFLKKKCGGRTQKVQSAVLQTALVDYASAIQVDGVRGYMTVCGGTDAWQTQVIHGATTTNLGLNGCWGGGEMNGEAVRVLTLLAVVGRNMHEYLGERGLPKLESIARDVFERVLGEVVSDEPVSVTKMDDMFESLEDRRDLRLHELRAVVRTLEVRGK